MSIALESGPGLGGGGGRFGRVARCGAAYAAASPPASGGRGGSLSAGRDSGSPAAAAKWEWDGEEVEGGDGEVQSSYKGSPFDTMDALQEALPYRKGVSKFYNSKAGSFAKPPAAVIPSPPSVKGLPKPETPSPRKRKGFLPFSFKWGKTQNKEVYPEDDVVDSPSPTTCRRMTMSPAATSSSGSNSGSDDEAQKLPPRRPPRRSGSGSGMGVFASPPMPRPPKLFPAHNRSQSMRELQDVSDSTAMVSPRDKRRKN